MRMPGQVLAASASLSSVWKAGAFELGAGEAEEDVPRGSNACQLLLAGSRPHHGRSFDRRRSRRGAVCAAVSVRAGLAASGPLGGVSRRSGSATVGSDCAAVSVRAGLAASVPLGGVPRRSGGTTVGGGVDCAAVSVRAGFATSVPLAGVGAFRRHHGWRRRHARGRRRGRRWLLHLDLVGELDRRRHGRAQRCTNRFGRRRICGHAGDDQGGILHIRATTLEPPSSRRIATAMSTQPCGAPSPGCI